MKLLYNFSLIFVLILFLSLYINADGVSGEIDGEEEMEVKSISNIFSDICTLPVVSLDYNYDFSKLRYKLFKYEYHNLIYYVNLCSNYSSPCLPQDSVCMTLFNGSKLEDLAFSSTLNIISNGVEGLSLYYSGGQCRDTSYNTTVMMLCNELDSSEIVDIIISDCDYKIIIESPYACGTYIQDTGSFNIIIFLATLFGTILSFICLAGCIYSIGKVFNRCCREGNGYQSISEASSSSHPEKIQHEYTDGKLSQQGELCTICCENKVNTVLLNCGHAVLCVECTEKLAKCPLCRSEIVKVVKIYQV